MTIKSYELDDIKILINEHENLYNVLYFSNKFTTGTFAMGYEDADEIFDYWLEIALGEVK